MQEKYIRCTICDAEFSNEEVKGIGECPRCKTKILPCDIKNDVLLKINLHELRILTIWAENWAYHCDNLPANLDNPNYISSGKTLNAICQRIHNQLKDKDVCLTLREEIEEIKQKGIDAKLYRNGGEDVEF